MPADQVKKLEELKARHSALERQKLQAEAEKQHLDSEEARLLAEAKEKFGVSSVEELRDLSGKAHAENEEAIALFESELNAIQEELAAASAQV